MFSDGVTYEATKILEDNIQGGTGTHANIGCPAGGKTGTTDNNTDAWFVGFTPRLATAVWVGYPDERVSMNYQYHGGPVDGGTFPAEIWGTYMKSIIGHFCGPFPQPKEPFVTHPFFGEYSTSGANKLGFGSRGKDQQPTPTPDSTKPNDTNNNDNTGGTQFNPDQYESPPQPTPDTGTPPGQR